MQDYGSGGSIKSVEFGEGEGRERSIPPQDVYQSSQHQFAVMQSKNYGCSNKDLSDTNMATYCRVATGIYEASVTSQYCQSTRNTNQSAPTFSSPPNSPLVGLLFDPSSPNYGRPGMSGERNMSVEKRAQSLWSNQEPIGTGAKKKIVKSQDKRSSYSADPRYYERYKDSSVEIDRQRKIDRNLTSESTSSLDFYVEGERMVSELCNITETSSRNDLGTQNQIQKCSNQDDVKKAAESSEVLLTALDKILIHDQIPNQIVQLAIEACTDAENIAIAHHNRPCFKNIHSICAKTRSNVQKPDSAVANLHSQGIPWVIKNFIFSFVRILDGWKGVKELLSEKHDTFSRIENKYYSPNIRDCFIQWQAVTKEMLTHIYKTFKCLDHGFTMEQKSFTHNYYATNSAAPRHQNQNKYQPSKSHVTTPRPVNASPQQYHTLQPPWVQSHTQIASQNFSDTPWPSRSGVPYKKCSMPPSNSYNLNDQCEMDGYQKTQYKYDPCSVREAKPRQSWTITNVPDFRTLEGACHSEQRELYNQLKNKMDAELGKAPGQSLISNLPCDLIQKRDMDLKAKMIPLSHVEKTLIPSMASAAEMRNCFVQKNNSCGDTKEESDFFAAWGQMVQKEPNDYITHHTHNIQTPSNVVTISNNISGPVQFIDTENDEFHEISKVYMKPGSYKVPIKPADPVTALVKSTSQEVVFESLVEDEICPLNMKIPFPSVTLAPQPKYNIESWPCLMSRNGDNVFGDELKLLPRHGVPCLDMRAADSFDILGALTSDRAWEAAKQSAPKLMDFIHEGSSKSDAVRLFDALGLTSTDDFSDELKQMKLNMALDEAWPPGPPINRPLVSEMSTLWGSQTISKSDFLGTKTQDQSMITEDLVKLLDADTKHAELDDGDIKDSKIEDAKETIRCPSYDQTGNYVRDDNQKKSGGKSKCTVSGMWYHPKKKKPLPNATVKKFETIILSLSQIPESAFIQHDMDIKMAPRFYEIVKYPMCFHDISTKLKNASYAEYEQVVQDFKRIFNNVRLYLKSYPDSTMKRNVNKVSAEFEKILANEFQSNCETKSKVQENIDSHANTNKKDKKENDNNTASRCDETNKKNVIKPNTDDKK